MNQNNVEQNNAKENFSLNNFFAIEENKKVIEKCELISESENDILNIGGFTGCGKTHLLIALNEFFENKGKKCELIDSFHLFEIFKKKEILKKYFDNKIILFDDIDFVIKTNLRFFSNICKILISKNIKIICSYNFSRQKYINEFIRNIKKSECAFFEKYSLKTISIICEYICTQRNVKLSNEAKEFICNRNSKGNIRKLYNDIYTMEVYCEDDDKKFITSNDAKNILLKTMNKKTDSKYNNDANSLINSVCQYFNFDKELIKTKNKNRKAVNIRNICIYGMYTYFHFPSTLIKKVFLLNSPSSVLNAVNAVKNKMKNDIYYQKDIEHIFKNI
ncbi:MAG: hypothetical protein LBF02_01665 [Mycoplasmataceae bacterium]|jgi:chromosomal replication initiation ATPase DnaA|nr:hypothetical protein [Mycoplasmataceae bacterium]